jgi:hypothetical protein
MRPSVWSNAFDAYRDVTSVPTRDVVAVDELVCLAMLAESIQLSLSQIGQRGVVVFWSTLHEPFDDLMFGQNLQLEQYSLACIRFIIQ